MKYPCIESTVEFYLIGSTIRLWINEEEILDDYHQESIYKNAWAFCRDHSPSLQELIEYFRKEIPTLNAIQIKKSLGAVQYGVVAYLVDFENHG